MYDLDDLSDDFEAALAELAEIAGVQLSKRRPKRSAERGGNGHEPGRRIGTTSTVSIGRSEDGEP
jgi:hypothetical protein